MKLARFGDDRLAIVDGDELVDVTAELDGEPLGLASSPWQQFCAHFDELRPRLEAAVSRAPRRHLSDCRLRAPVANPSKIIAAASNYGEHVEEMRDRVDQAWLLDFDVFLKAPSSIADPGTTVTLPAVEGPIEFEAELALVVQHGGRDTPPDTALQHVLGCVILIDITLRGKGDRSRRKSYPGFSPIGPWLVTMDEIGDLNDLEIRLWSNDELKQDVRAGTMLRSPAQVLSYSSEVMELVPGDVISTGAPPGVGAVTAGDRIRVDISHIGAFEIDFDERATA